MVAKMAKIGIVPGQDFDIGKLDPAVAKGLQASPRRRFEKIMADFKTARVTDVNGWHVHHEDRASTAPITCSAP